MVLGRPAGVGLVDDSIVRRKETVPERVVYRKDDRQECTHVTNGFVTGLINVPFYVRRIVLSEYEEGKPFHDIQVSSLVSIAGQAVERQVARDTVRISRLFDDEEPIVKELLEDKGYKVLDEEALEEAARAFTW